VKIHRCVIAVILGTLATVACAGDDTRDDVETAPANFDAQSSTDESKSTHLWIVNRGVDILSKHTTDIPEAANTLAWMKDEQCKKQWQRGLLEADFLAPYNAAATDLTIPDGASHEEMEALNADFEVAVSQATWMTHFSDPDTGKNYLGFKMSSEIPTELGHPSFRAIKKVLEANGPVPVEAKGATLFRAARAVDLLSGKDVKSDHAKQPAEKRARGCYELGIALHYVTDISQPMHSANFAATDRPRLLHSHFEGYAQELQAKFALPDWSSPPKGDLATVVQTMSVTAKARWVTADKKLGPLQKAFMDAYKQGSTFNDDARPTADILCRAARDELAVAGFISLDVPKCWRNNAAVLKETGVVLGIAQEAPGRFLATLALPKH
jgi:hypothetical protein